VLFFLGLGGCQGCRPEEITAAEREGRIKRIATGKGTNSVLQDVQFRTSFISPSFFRIALSQRRGISWKKKPKRSKDILHIVVWTLM